MSPCGKPTGAIRLGPKLVERSPVTVRVQVPAGAEALLQRPLQLAHVEGKPLALQDVSLVFEPAGGAAGGRAPVGERLRMLAVFSVPTDVSALALRRERYRLSRLVHEIAVREGRALELRVLQYGASRERLTEVLEEGEGWDAVHFSGHGLAGGLVLEREDGSQDRIATEELVGLLRPARERLKLVTLSSCESAAATAAETLRLLGIAPPRAVEARAPAAAAPALPALAQELTRRLGCAVLAMRYPVDDDFAIAIAEALYELLLGKGNLLPRALQLALARSVRRPPEPGARPSRWPPPPSSAPWPPGCG